jgi:hypothetical protein
MRMPQAGSHRRPVEVSGCPLPDMGVRSRRSRCIAIDLDKPPSDRRTPGDRFLRT